MWPPPANNGGGRQRVLLPSLQGQLSGKHRLTKREHCQGPTPRRKDLVFSAGPGKLKCVNDGKTGLQSPADRLDLTLLLHEKTPCNVPYLEVVCGVGRQVRSAVVVAVVRRHLWPGVVGHRRVRIFDRTVQRREGRSLLTEKSRESQAANQAPGS